MEVSNSGYYAWRNKPGSNRGKENLRLLTHIKAVHKESKNTYGSPRIHVELCSRGIRCGKNRVARLMKQNGIQAKHKRKFKATTDSNHNLPVHENKLNRSFGAESVDKAWVADITYIWTREGWLYLAVILDLFSRNRRLVDERDLGKAVGNRRSFNGSGDQGECFRNFASLGSGQSICEQKVPAPAKKEGYLLLNEQESQLLG